MIKELSLRLFSCIGVDRDLPLLPHFLDHYLALGVPADRMHFILNAANAMSSDLARAVAQLGAGGTAAPEIWIGPYTSGEMWRRRQALQARIADPEDWVISADIDEFHMYSAPLREVFAKCEADGVTVLQGPLIDRIASGGRLPSVAPGTPLHDQFPIEADVMCPIGKRPGENDAAGTVKMMAFRGRVLPRRGGHNPEPGPHVRYSHASKLSDLPRIKEAAFRFAQPQAVHHYKWTAGLEEHLQRRRDTPGASPAGSVYGNRLLNYLESTGGVIRLEDIAVRCDHRDRPGGTAPTDAPGQEPPPGPARTETQAATDLAGPGAVAFRPEKPAASARDGTAAHPPEKKAASALGKPAPPDLPRTHRPPAGDPPRGGAGWRVRQITTGTEQDRFHSHSYYDIRVLDESARYVAAHEMRFQNRWMTADDCIEVGLADLHSGGFEPVGTSTAWSWQQGPMAQWIPGTTEMVWNCRDGDGFAARVHNHKTGRQRSLPRIVYAVSPSGDFALSVNMARLDQVRPGYGYVGGGGARLDEGAPSDDGVWRMALDTGESCLVLSLERAVACLFDAIGDAEARTLRETEQIFWFNHVKMSQDGSRFTVKLRWRVKSLAQPWRGPQSMSLTCGTDGHELRPLIRGGSHVMWLDRDRLYCWDQPRKRLALVPDDGVPGNPIEDFDTGIFDQNVHVHHLPSRPGHYLYDKPYSQSVALAEFDSHNRSTAETARFENHEPPHGPFRCDLHPVPTPDGSLVIVTSMHDGGRQIYAVEREGRQE